MRGNDLLGLVFSNAHDELIRELTDNRTMGSVPFGGRYRLIDFSLSNLTHAGVTKVGIVTKSNYQSLMIHLGGGKPWDLARKTDGIFWLPPYGTGRGQYKSRIDALTGVVQFLNHSKQEYVVMCDADVVSNIDLELIVDEHIDRGADITVVYKEGIRPKGNDVLVLEVDEHERVTEMQVSPKEEAKCAFGIDIFIMRRELLMELVLDAASRNYKSFLRDILQNNVSVYKIYGHKVEEYVAIIDSMRSFIAANMDLLDYNIRTELFNSERPVCTKVRDDMPAKYGLGSSVSNALVADGCIIEGEVKNCVLFRGVKVGEGTALNSCIIMQDTVIGKGANLSYVTTDKDVTIRDGRTLMGFESYPVFISKGSNV